MILFATTNVLNFLPNKYIVYNLSAYIEGIQRIYLLPPDDISSYYADEKTFDLLYADFIFKNDFSFMELMKIIIPIYEGKDVVLLISESLENITESLLKFINGRYGIIPSIVTDEEDLDMITESNFTLNGLYNLDQDKNRFSRLYAMTNINDQGEIDYNGF